MLIDSHAHLNFQDFDSDWREVAAECLEQNIWVINVGSQLATSQKAVKIAESFDQGIYAAVGLHPIHVLGGSFHPESFKDNEYQRIIDGSDKVVAIGETGIDFFHNDNHFDQQRAVFKKHLDLALYNSLPVVIHARNSQDGKVSAYERILDILKDYPTVSGVVHCFGGSLEEARLFVDKGFFVGFTGIITFDKTKLLEEICRQLPLDKILIETDCPYLAPHPYRGKRNQPQYVKYVAEKIAEVKDISFETVASQTTLNIKKLFSLP